MHGHSPFSLFFLQFSFNYKFSYIKLNFFFNKFERYSASSFVLDFDFFFFCYWNWRSIMSWTHFMLYKSDHVKIHTFKWTWLFTFSLILFFFLFSSLYILEIASVDLTDQKILFEKCTFSHGIGIIHYYRLKWLPLISVWSHKSSL